MNKISRRALSRYAVDQLITGKKSAALAKQLAATLAQQKKADEIEFLLNDILWELEHRRVLTIGSVTAAHPLNQKLEGDLSEHLKKATGSREVSLETSVDKSVIGGFRVRTAGRIWDQTISGRLAQLRESK